MEIFPTALVESVIINRADRVLRDEFEAGGIATRRLWPKGYFRRIITIQTTPLTWEEFRVLRSFFTRHGTHEPFIFRDNVGRTGNIEVRFTGSFPEERHPETHQVRFDLEETAARRAQIEIEEIAAIAQPCLWYDANQVDLLYHHGQFQLRDENIYDGAYQNYPGIWQTGQTTLDDNAALQQGFKFNGTIWAKTAGDIAEIVPGMTEPECSLFAIVKAPASDTTKKVLMHIGDMGDGNGMGIALAADNYFEPYLGGSETFTNARAENSAPGQWVGVTMLWYAGSGGVRICINGELADAAANPTRNFVQGPFSLGAAIDGSNPVEDGTILAHVLVFPERLTPVKLTALHNLFAPQFGLPLAS